MCGRYASATSAAVLVKEFQVADPPRATLPADYNVAPTKDVYAVVVDDSNAEPTRLLTTMRWGLVPSWAKDIRIGNRMINARIETVADKPAYRRAWHRRRALLPADGYYEWYTPDVSATAGPDAPAPARGKPRKQPYYIHDPSGRSLAMAGLYEFWRDPKAAPDDPHAWLRTTVVLTAASAGPLSHIHDRMPVLVDPSQWEDWLDPQFGGDPAQLLDPPATAAGLVAYPVSTLVNAVRNNGPELIEPLPAE